MPDTNEAGVVMEGEEDFSRWNWGETCFDELLEQYATICAQTVLKQIARDCWFSIDSLCAEGQPINPEDVKIEFVIFEADVVFSTGLLSLIDKEIASLQGRCGSVDAADVAPLVAMLEAALARIKAKIRA